MKIIRSQKGHIYIGIDPGFIRVFGKDKLPESSIHINDEGNIVISYRKDANMNLNGTYIRTDESGSKFYLEFGSNLVQAFGEDNLLKSSIQIDKEGNIVIIPHRNPKDLENIKKRTKELMKQYREDISILKD